MFQSWGAHTINMTTCPEVTLAKELSLPYASVAIVTDYDCWRDNVDSSEHVGVEAVLKMFKANIEKVTGLLVGVIPKIAQVDWKPIVEANQQLVKSSLV